MGEGCLLCVATIKCMPVTNKNSVCCHTLRCHFKLERQHAMMVRRRNRARRPIFPPGGLQLRRAGCGCSRPCTGLWNRVGARLREKFSPATASPGRHARLMLSFLRTTLYGFACLFCQFSLHKVLNGTVCR